MTRNPHGSFVWYELMTPDPAAAKAFYERVLDWTVAETGTGEIDYRTIATGDCAVGGLLPLSPEMVAGGAQPCWLGYLGVDDVDACVSAAQAAGASVHLAPFDTPGVGRIAMLADPQGAPFYVMRAESDAESTAFAYDAPRIGHCAWNELGTSDPQAAWTFYGDLFGWVKDGAMDMGPLGQYEFIRHGARMLGAIMPKMPQAPATAWTFYFRVADIDVAAAAIKSAGGTLFADPMEIPGGDYSLNAADPQGAAFGLVGPRIARDA